MKVGASTRISDRFIFDVVNRIARWATCMDTK